LHCWWECKLIQPLWKIVWRFLEKLGIKPPYDPATPLLGIYPEETRIERDTCTPMFIFLKKQRTILNKFYFSTMKLFKTVTSQKKKNNV